MTSKTSRATVAAAIRTKVTQRSSFDQKRLQ